jgi:hypothetical protein
MMDGRLFKRLLGGAGALHVGAAAAAFLLGKTDIALGLLLGFVLGAIPFASWAWIAQRGLSTARNQVLVVLLLAGKLAVYSGLLYLLVTKEIANPFAVMIGITAVVGILCVGYLLQTAPKEPAKC